MALSALADNAHEPTDTELRHVLGRAYPTWVRLISAVEEQVGPLSKVWGFTSKSTGWGLRLRREDRVILYMTPQAGRFLVSLALGERAVQAAHHRRLPAAILKAIDTAPRYAEGRGVRFEVSKDSQVLPLARLARVKQEN